MVRTSIIFYGNIDNFANERGLFADEGVQDHDEELIARQHFIDNFEYYMSLLTEKQSVAVKLFLMKRSLSGVARVMGITRQGASKHFYNAVKKMRQGSMLHRVTCQQ